MSFFIYGVITGIVISIMSTKFKTKRKEELETIESKKHIPTYSAEFYKAQTEKS